MKLLDWHKIVKKYYDGTYLLNPPLSVQNNDTHPADYIYSGQAGKAKALSDEAKKIMTAIPKFIIEPQPLKHLGDKEKTIGFGANGVDNFSSSIGTVGAELTAAQWENSLKKPNSWEEKYPKGGDATEEIKKMYIKKLGEQIASEKKQGSGYKNKLMKVNNEIVTKEYHIYASHPSEFKNCKACRVILNFFRWQKKSITPPKDTFVGASYSPPKQVIYDNHVGVIIDDPPPPFEATKTKKPMFVFKKGSPSFSHYKKQTFGINAIGWDTEMKNLKPDNVCITKSSPGCSKQLCLCGEVIIKWE